MPRDSRRFPKVGNFASYCRCVKTARRAARHPGAEATHSFLGRLGAEEWGRMMGKHLDHHLRQFGL